MVHKSEIVRTKEKNHVIKQGEAVADLNSGRKDVVAEAEGKITKKQCFVGSFCWKIGAKSRLKVSNIVAEKL